MSMRNLDFLKTLKAGDPVYIARSSRWNVRYSKCTVSRTLKTQIIIEIVPGSPSRFRREDGREMYKGFESRWLVEASPEFEKQLADKYRLEQLTAHAKGLVEGLIIPTTADELRTFIKALLPYTPAREDKAYEKILSEI